MLGLSRDELPCSEIVPMLKIALLTGRAGLIGGGFQSGEGQARSSDSGSRRDLVFKLLPASYLRDSVQLTCSSNTVVPSLSSVDPLQTLSLQPFLQWKLGASVSPCIDLAFPSFMLWRSLQGCHSSYALSLCILLNNSGR